MTKRQFIKKLLRHEMNYRKFATDIFNKCHLDLAGIESLIGFPYSAVRLSAVILNLPAFDEKHPIFRVIDDILELHFIDIENENDLDLFVNKMFEIKRLYVESKKGNVDLNSFEDYFQRNFRHPLSIAESSAQDYQT